MRYLLVCLVAVVFVTGCAGFVGQNVPLTPESRYLTAVTIFNDNVELYEMAYQAADSKTKEKWKAEIDPVILSTSTALDVWNLTVNDPASEQDYRAFFRQLLTVLILNGIIEIRED
jgi:hypothetical protein